MTGKRDCSGGANVLDTLGRVEGTVVGSLDWQLDGRSGCCGMDLELTAEPDLSGNEPGVSGTLSGTLCDHDGELEIESVSGPDDG